MIDTSDLEWYMSIELKSSLTLGELNELLDRLGRINESWCVGTEDDDQVRVTKDGDLGIELDRITDSDMPEVLRILTDYKVYICEIGHQVDRGLCFYKVFNVFSPGEMVEVYRHVLIETANPKLTWDAWKEESGFNDFVKEVYCDGE
ncbi:MAG: hypothetical protein E7Z65_06210 [Thermoplasmata archaeon]|nr:hypothetical protein [Thermoplasmata archaeon]